jgi:hypothetical protein
MVQERRHEEYVITALTFSRGISSYTLTMPA